MKNNKFKKSLFIAIFIMLLFRLLFIPFPIHSSVATIIIPKDYELDEINFGIGGYAERVKCININVSFDKLNNQTIFSLNSRSLNKQKSIKCIEDGANFIKSIINKKNAKVDSLLLESDIFNKRIDDLINDLNSSKSLDKEKLILINDYFTNITNLRKYKKIQSPLPFEINTNPIKNSNLFRYLFSVFILVFWTSYIVLIDSKNISD